MRTEKLLQVWNIVRTRAITFYILVIAVLAWGVDYQAVISHARGATLSRLMPSFEYLKQLAAGSAKIDRKELKEYAYYYEIVNEYMPRPDALGVLGYIYFHLGQDKKAVTCFLKAAAADPQSFSFHYNLGVIYFNRGFYAEAVESLKKALDTSVDVNMSYITSSKIYYPFLGSQEDLAYRLKEHLRKGSYNAYRLLISGSLYRKDYQSMLYYATAGISSAVDKDKDFYYFAGLAAFHLKQYKQAAMFFKECIAANPDDSNALYYLGLSLRALGEERAAEGVLASIKKINQSGSNMKEIKPDLIPLHIF